MTQPARRSKPPATAAMEALFGAQPLSLTPAGKKWGIGRVVPAAPEELSPNPRWGIWDLETGKLVFGLPGALAVALSNDQKQIAVWREELAPAEDRPFFGGKARTDFRWSFERRRWPAHDRVLSRMPDLRNDLVRNWPISIEFSPDDACVTLTCRSESGEIAEIYVECAARGPDRLLDRAPPAPRTRSGQGAKPEKKSKRARAARPASRAKAEPKSATPKKSRAAKFRKQTKANEPKAKKAKRKSAKRAKPKKKSRR